MLTLHTPMADFEALWGRVNGAKATILQIPRATLANILMDHSAMVNALKGSVREPGPKNLKITPRAEARP